MVVLILDLLGTRPTGLHYNFFFLHYTLPVKVDWESVSKHFTASVLAIDVNLLWVKLTLMANDL